jgi:uncharacterized protein YfkK (UPF0435 family)
MEIGAAYLVSQIQNLNLDDIRQYLSIKNDFSPEEEAAIAKENELHT